MSILTPKNKTADLLKDIRDRKNISVFGMPFYSRAIVLSELGCFLYVCADYVKAQEAFVQLKSLRQDVVYVPALDDVLSAYKNVSDNRLSRLSALCALANGSARVAVTSVQGYMQLFPRIEDIRRHTVTMKKDNSYDTVALIKKLLAAGYTREEQLSDAGQFALRGDILDITPINLKTGVRIDFFDDFAERIRIVDLDTQLAGEEIAEVFIAPNTEVFLPLSDKSAPAGNNGTVGINELSGTGGAGFIYDAYTVDNAINTINKSVNKKLDPQYAVRQSDLVQELIVKIEGGGSLPDCLKPLFPHARLSDYFDTIIFDEQKQCVDNQNSHLSEHRSRLTSLLSRGEAFPFMEGQLEGGLSPTGTDSALNYKNDEKNDKFAYVTQSEPASAAIHTAQTAKSKNQSLQNQNKRALVSFDKILCQNRIFSPEKVYNFTDPELPSYAKNMQALADDIKMWQGRGMKIRIIASGILAKNLTDFLSENNIGTGIIEEGHLHKGGCFFEENTIVIGRGDLTFKQAPLPLKNKKAAFFQPKIGDYVVHNVHGIGLCEGLKRMKTGESERDFIVVRYDGGDRLYVAVESINLLSAYGGEFSEDGVKLNKIGGAEFARIKDKVKASIKKMAFDLRELYGRRESAKGHKYNPDNYALAEFESDFPYEETPDQLTAVAEGLSDLTAGKIMDRLLCGDVGYGKTEVAMRLAYKVILEGKQAAFISPTTILARQHFASLKKRMEKHGAVVRSLTRFDSAESIKKTLSDLQKGNVDIVCGTHRALSKDVVFKDLGLLVLDEEQRFGVADKERIKLLKTDVNVLSLSATPIPRTLHMAMSGMRDISLLTTPPPTRIPVSTYVAEYTESLVFDAVEREIGRGGQVFIVYNRVEKIESFAAGIKNIFPDLRINIAHGQMEKTRLENTIGDFVDGKTDILITSTIIENGIDMANVNTMIIVDADRLGLSQLYQLRGRIGRGSRLAYAFFTYDGKKTLTENAYKRLDAITSYTEFGSGLKLAMRDLEIRGAGNILGREQHGHMQKVGYEMYLKLIGEVMDEFDGKNVERTKEITVITDFPAFIPEDYVADIEWRLKLYKRAAEVGSEDEARQELARLKDVYGDPPKPVRNLLTVAVIKNLATVIGALRVTLTHKTCEIAFDKEKLDIPLVRFAVENGFNYSAAQGTVFLRPEAGAARKLLNFLRAGAGK